MKIYHLAGALTLLVASTQAPLAVPITGNLGFTGLVTLNGSSPGTATAVTSWIDPVANGDSGSFAGIANGTAVAMAPGMWNFNTTSPINNFWSVAGFTFELISSYVLQQGGVPGSTGFVVVDGTGIVSGNGYSPTTMSFNITTSDPFAGSSPLTWTFQSSDASSGVAVADGGSTLMLMGLALTGVAWMMRKKQPDRNLPAC